MLVLLVLGDGFNLLQRSQHALQLGELGLGQNQYHKLLEMQFLKVSKHTHHGPCGRRCGCPTRILRDSSFSSAPLTLTSKCQNVYPRDLLKATEDCSAPAHGGLKSYKLTAPESSPEPTTKGSWLINTPAPSPLRVDHSQACALHHFLEFPRRVKLHRPQCCLT